MFRSAEAATSLLGSLKIAGSLRAGHYHVCPYRLFSPSVPTLPPLTFTTPPLGFCDVLFLHSLQDAVFCHGFDYSGRWEQMFVRNDQSINQREEKACRAGVRCICLNPALVFVTGGGGMLVTSRKTSSVTNHSSLYLTATVSDHLQKLSYPHTHTKRLRLCLC